MQVYLAVTPGQLQEASRFTRSFVHMAYRIGPESTLLRQALLVQTRGGLLGLSGREAPIVEDPEKLAAAALRECGRRGYGGIVLDWDGPVRGDLLPLARTLDALTRKNRLTLCVPEGYAAAAESARTGNWTDVPEVYTPSHFPGRATHDKGSASVHQRRPEAASRAPRRGFRPHGQLDGCAGDVKHRLAYPSLFRLRGSRKGFASVH